MLPPPACGDSSVSAEGSGNFARSWVLDLKDRGLRVHVLSPGATLTPGLQRAAGSPEQERALLAGLVGQPPAGRIGQPEETAAVALLLAPDDSSFMTGSKVFVDEGLAQV